MRLIAKSNLHSASDTNGILDECIQIARIINVSITTAKKKLNN